MQTPIERQVQTAQTEEKIFGQLQTQVRRQKIAHVLATHPETLEKWQEDVEAFDRLVSSPYIG